MANSCGDQQSIQCLSGNCGGKPCSFPFGNLDCLSNQQYGCTPGYASQCGGQTAYPYAYNCDAYYGDNIQNLSETDVDCGGKNLAKCAVGKKCSFNSDCMSNACNGGVCANSGFKPPENCELTTPAGAGGKALFCCQRNQNNCYRVPGLDNSCNTYAPSTPYGMKCDGGDLSLYAKGCISGISGTCCPFQIIP
jgi:hypothetical protein